jgi:hypothetical protein
MFLQLWPVIYIVQTRQTIVGVRAMARKKIKLEEEAIEKFWLLTLPGN